MLFVVVVCLFAKRKWLPQRLLRFCQPGRLGTSDCTICNVKSAGLACGSSSSGTHIGCHAQRRRASSELGFAPKIGDYYYSGILFDKVAHRPREFRPNCTFSESSWQSCLRAQNFKSMRFSKSINWFSSYIYIYLYILYRTETRPANENLVTDTLAHTRKRRRWLAVHKKKSIYMYKFTKLNTRL